MLIPVGVPQSYQLRNQERSDQRREDDDGGR